MDVIGKVIAEEFRAEAALSQKSMSKRLKDIVGAADAGDLPAQLDVVGKLYDIRADFRNILQIFMAFEDKDMSEQEKAYVFLKRMYTALESIQEKDYKAAYDAAFVFIECSAREEKPSPRVVNWERDEQMIFSAINKVAGVEVRAVPFLHWWTFLGHFQSIDHESLWGMCVPSGKKGQREEAGKARARVL